MTMMRRGKEKEKEKKEKHTALSVVQLISTEEAFAKVRPRASRSVTATSRRDCVLSTAYWLAGNATPTPRQSDVGSAEMCGMGK